MLWSSGGQLSGGQQPWGSERERERERKRERERERILINSTNISFVFLGSTDFYIYLHWDPVVAHFFLF